MVKLITIPNDNEPVINRERRRIVKNTPAGWTYVAYNKESDHTTQTAKAGARRPLQILDFDCHGSPTRFNHTDLQTLTGFARNLMAVPGFSTSTGIYLDACNTGLRSFAGGPIAQALADATRSTVYGTIGYMTGTFAEHTEQCFASVNGLSYPGAADATGPAVWKRFTPAAPPPAAAGGRSMSFTITVRADGPLDGAGKQIVAVVQEALNRKPVEFPPFRMAPDVTINYLEGDRVWILDVFSNGGLIKDRETNEAFRVAAENLQQFQTAMHMSLGLE